MFLRLINRSLRLEAQEVCSFLIEQLRKAWKFDTSTLESSNMALKYCFHRFQSSIEVTDEADCVIHRIS